MAMILDHINGIRDDNRIENLQIVCPNCAATLDTHCGRKNRVPKSKRSCRRCGRGFFPGRPGQRYCSQECGTRWDRSKLRGRAVPAYRRVERPPYEQLRAEIDATSYCAVGRKYGVSDNAVRKWIRFYARERERDGCAASE
jgi:ribosomal protein S27AE